MTGPWARLARRRALRAAREEAGLLDAEMRRELAVLDLRLWILDVLRHHAWGRRREFSIVEAPLVGLYEADPVGAFALVDTGSLVVTTRRLTFAGSRSVRNVELRRVVAWSHIPGMLAVGAAHDEHIWHLTGLAESDSFLAAVTLNLADNALDDDHPFLDLVDPADIEAYAAAFEAAEVSPHRQSLSQIARRLDTLDGAVARGQP